MPVPPDWCRVPALAIQLPMWKPSLYSSFLKEITFKVSNDQHLGNPESRAAFSTVTHRLFDTAQGDLVYDSQRRFGGKHPLRVLDSKERRQGGSRNALSILDFLMKKAKLCASNVGKS